jgi:hypothetical protein
LVEHNITAVCRCILIVPSRIPILTLHCIPLQLAAPPPG